MKTFLRTEAGLRLGLRDVAHQAVTSPLRALSQLGERVVSGVAETGVPREQHVVLDGFETTNPSGTQVQVDLGGAVLGTSYAGETLDGLVLTSGEPVRIIDIGSYADGQYGVYVRLELAPETYENRTFWDPAATPNPAETTRNVATRVVEDWSLAIDFVSPGPEWMQVSELQKTGAVLVISDLRPWAFDTDTAGTGTRWGSATDRVIPRTAPSRITSVAQFAQMALEQLSGIIGARTGDTQHPFRNVTAGDADAGTGYVGLGQLNEVKLSAQGGQQAQYLPFDRTAGVPGAPVSPTFLHHANVPKAYGVVQRHTGSPVLLAGSFRVTSVAAASGGVLVTLPDAFAGQIMVVPSIAWLPATASAPAVDPPEAPFWDQLSATTFVMYETPALLGQLSAGFGFVVYGVHA